MHRIMASLVVISAACSLAACEKAPGARTGTVERRVPAQKRTGTVERRLPAQERTGTVERTAPEEQTGTVERTAPAEK